MHHQACPPANAQVIVFACTSGVEGGMYIVLVVTATDEGLSAGGQALGRVVLVLGYWTQGHLTHEGVAPLILLVWPCLMHKHQVRFGEITKRKCINDSDDCRAYETLVPSTMTIDITLEKKYKNKNCTL